MKRYSLHFLYLLFNLFHISCSEKPKEITEPAMAQKQIVEPKEFFFDLKQYMENQIAVLDSLKPKAKKIVTTDGTRETKIIDNINWKRELQPFLEVDLNKPACKDSYSIDTVADSNDKDAYTIMYQTKDLSLTTKLMTIEFNHYRKPIQITVVNKTKNNLYSSYQNLIYRPLIGYSISGSQDVNVAQKSNYSIEVKFE